MLLRSWLLSSCLLKPVFSREVSCAAGDNCTTVLQAAIDAGGDLTVTGTFTVLPIWLRSSDQTLTFAPGSLVIAQRGAYHADADHMFNADGAHNVTINGYGARWMSEARAVEPYWSAAAVRPA